MALLDDAHGSVSDRIVLTIPTDSAFRGVASLVLGGVGSRLDLPYERMDDLQLAVLSMLDAARDEQVSIEIHAEDDVLRVAVGPLPPDAGGDEGLALVLRRLTDGVEPGRRDDGDWLTVSIQRGATTAGSTAS